MTASAQYRLVARAFLPGALLLVSLLTSCGNSQIAWKEQVELQSGEVITVKRTAKTKDFGEVGGPGGWENEGMTVQIVQPLKADDPPVWDAKFVPLVFDREPGTNEWFIVATFISCSSWYELGRPKLPYTEFRLKDGRWRQQPLSPQLIGRDANMLTHISSTDQRDHTLASKASVLAEHPAIAPEYKKVVNKWATSC
jgi:hypothetical protein